MFLFPVLYRLTNCGGGAWQAHELLALEILTLLLENATDDSVEVAIGFLKESGQKLGEVSPRGLTAIFDRLRHVLHEVRKLRKHLIDTSLVLPVTNSSFRL